MEQSKKQIAYRSVEFQAETKTDGDKTKRIIRGYAVLFNVEATVYDYWYGEIKEIILPQALNGVDLEDLYLIRDHDTRLVLGKKGINMRVEVDETGLFFECELPDTQVGRDTYTEIEMGLIDGMSFGAYFSDPVNSETKTRTVTHFDELFEISVTPFPAYKEASVVAKTGEAEKSAEQAKQKAEQEAKDREEFIKFMEDL